MKQEKSTMLQMVVTNLVQDIVHLEAIRICRSKTIQFILYQVYMFLSADVYVKKCVFLFWQ